MVWFPAVAPFSLREQEINDKQPENAGRIACATMNAAAVSLQ